MEELDREENQVIYRTIDTSFFNEVEGPENIQLIFSVTDEGETVIRSVELQAQTEGLVGKNTVDLKYWHTISHNVHEYTPRYDSNNRLLPYEDWIPQSVTHRYELADFDRFFSFCMENVKQSTRQYVCQILVQTTDGKKYGSELIEWKNQEERKNTEKGKSKRRQLLSAI